MRESDRRRADPNRDKRYEQLVELSPDGIIIHDGALIVAANLAALRLAGAATRDALVGQPVSLLLDPPYLKGVERQLTGDVSAAEMAPPVRETMRRLDGTSIEVEVRAAVFMDRDRPAAHLVIRDITDRLMAEVAWRHSDELLQRSRRAEAVGALAGGVSHEVNNMMSIILGYGAFLLEDSAMPTGRLESVREIMRAAERAASVTAQLLAFSRQGASNPKLVDVAAAVQQLEPSLHRLLGTERRLEVRIDGSAMAQIDVSQITQVMVHLVLNARDATGEGETIRIRVAHEVLDMPRAAADGNDIPPDRYATISVRDEGVGIDADVRPRLFEPFFTTKPVGKGSGLGLAAVQGIVSQHHGFISLTSAPDAGSEFTVFLPAVEAASDTAVGAAVGAASTDARQPVESTANAPVTSQPPTPPLDESRVVVLVVDDEPAIRKIVATALERAAGIHVLQAADGVDALELIDRLGPPTLVLTDLRMPRINGAELAQRLRAKWPELPILFMSGYSVEFLRLEGAIRPSDDVIEKPFTAESLVHRVRAALPRGLPAGHRAERR